MQISGSSGSKMPGEYLPVAERLKRIQKIILRSVAIEFSSHQSRSEPLLHAWLPMCWDLKQDMEMDLLASNVATKAHPGF